MNQSSSVEKLTADQYKKWNKDYRFFNFLFCWITQVTYAHVPTLEFWIIFNDRNFWLGQWSFYIWLPTENTLNQSWTARFLSNRPAVNWTKYNNRLTIEWFVPVRLTTPNRSLTAFMTVVTAFHHFCWVEWHFNRHTDVFIVTVSQSTVIGRLKRGHKNSYFMTTWTWDKERIKATLYW